MKTATTSVLYEVMDKNTNQKCKIKLIRHAGNETIEINLPDRAYMGAGNGFFGKIKVAGTSDAAGLMGISDTNQFWAMNALKDVLPR